MLSYKFSVVVLILGQGYTCLRETPALFQSLSSVPTRYFLSLQHCLKITQLLQIHSFWYLVSTPPLFCFLLSTLPPPISCKNNWKGRKFHGKKDSKHRYTTVWVNKGDCWGRLSLRLDKVTVWPADNWERSDAWGPLMSILFGRETGGLWAIIKDKPTFSCQCFKFAFYR